MRRRWPVGRVALPRARALVRQETQKNPWLARILPASASKARKQAPATGLDFRGVLHGTRKLCPSVDEHEHRATLDPYLIRLQIDPSRYPFGFPGDEIESSVVLGTLDKATHH